MMKVKIFGMMAAALFLLVACDSFSTEPGSFVVLFQWETGHEPDTAAKDYYMWAYYQEWKGGEGKTFPADIESNAKSLDEGGPVKLGSGDDLTFTKLTYGNSRFVRAAIWDNAARTGDPLYVGVSELFNFSASDRNKAVAVNMKLQANAGVDQTGGGGSFALEVRHNGTVAERVAQPTVTLRLTVKNADTVIIANDLNFEKGIIEKKLTELTKIDETTYELAAWDITEGWGDLGDALYSVFGKSRNTLGYESVPKRAEVYLDTTAPFLTVKTDALAYNASGIVTITVSSNETLKESPVIGIYDADEALVKDISADAEELQAGTSYRYQIPVIGTLDDGNYHIVTSAADLIDNTTADIVSDPFAVDSLAPELDGDPVITPGRIAAEQSYTVTFTAKEDMSGGLVTVQRKEETLTCTNTGLDYTCTGTSPAGEGDAIDPVTITLTDAAGNIGSFNAGTLYIDRTEPAVSGDATVVVSKPAGCPLPSITAAVDGSSIDVSFTVTEILAGDPVVRAMHGTDSIAFVLSGQTGYFYSYRAAAIDTSAIADGTYSFEIELTDEAGNTDTIAFPATGFELLTLKPASPAVDVAGKVIYKRIPWGSDATGGVKYFGIAAGSDAVDENAAWVYAYDAPDPATASEIGKAPVTGGTFAEFELNRADRKDVYIAVYDTACNRSDVVKVREVEWTATMGGKEPGSIIKNPNSFHVKGIVNATLEQDIVFKQEPSAAGFSYLKTSGQVNWELRSGDAHPSARQGHALAYDSTRGSILLFGGSVEGSRYNDETWVWNGIKWIQSNPFVKPAGRVAHAIAYDSARDEYIMFGGKIGVATFDNETWKWNGTSWEQLYSLTKPSIRTGHAMVYDSARGKIVLFGGFNESTSTYNNETWEWDGTDWSQLHPADKPAARSVHAMAYDSAREEIVLFGGHRGYPDSETWVWDGTNWTLRNPANRPESRAYHSMIYDSIRAKILLFGGDLGGVYSDETWEWDGTDWTQVFPANKPSPRYWHAMVHSSATGKTILFGGGGDNFTDETWIWDGENWVQWNSSNEPGMLQSHVMVYDAAHKNIVMFGGYDSSLSYYNDTWTWRHSANWIPLNPATKPSTRQNHAMAYDSARGKMVLFGGVTDGSVFKDETWEWNGAIWTQLNPANKPSSRGFHAMAYDSARGKVVLFGGSAASAVLNNETWEWDGANWAQLNPTNKPSSRGSHAMAYDSKRGKTVLFGGSTGSHYTNVSDETWEWDGVNWVLLDPATKPPLRRDHSMVYDHARDKTVVYGGSYNTIYGYEDVWEWDGTNWTAKTPATKPEGRANHAMTYDNDNDRIVLFGGNSGASYFYGTWEWNGGGNDRAGQIMNVSWESSGITDDGSIQSVSVLFNAGGLGDITGTPTNGVDLLAWKHDRWVKVSSNTAAPDNLAPVTWETTDPVEIQTLLNSGLRKFNFAVAPTAPNGFLTDMGSIATDYAEVIVRYTIQ